MDPTESISSDVFEPADACEQSALLSAYFDGELDPAASSRIERHLAGCEACRAELVEIREISVLAGQIGAGGISQARLRKIHRLVDVDQAYSVLRIAGALTALAASAMVIGSVWLSEIPTARPQSPFVVLPYGDSKAMEVAFDLRVDPLPKSGWESQHQQMFADARLAEWMLHDLSGRP